MVTLLIIGGVATLLLFFYLIYKFGSFSDFCELVIQILVLIVRIPLTIAVAFLGDGGSSGGGGSSDDY